MSDVATQRVLRNFAKLIGGRTVAALGILAATGLTASTLAPTQFGQIVLLHAYVLTIRGVLRCRAADALVRFGVDIETDRRRLTTLLSTTLGLDLVLAIMGTALAVGAAPLLTHAMGWPAETRLWAAGYGAVMLFSGTATAEGVLRLGDRFGLLAGQRVVGASTRVTGVALAVACDAPLSAFMVAWASALAAEWLYLLASGLHDLRARGIRPRLHAPATIRRELPGLGHYLAIGWWLSTLELVPRHLSTLLAGPLLGASAAGLLRLARDMANVLAKPARLLRQSALPDLVRLRSAGGAKTLATAARVMAVTTGPALALVGLAAVAAAPALATVLGAAYTPAAPLLILLLLAACLELAAAPLRAAAYALDRPGGMLVVQLTGTAIYLLLFVTLAEPAGLLGPGIASIAFALTTLGGLTALAMRPPRRRAVLGSAP